MLFEKVIWETYVSQGEEIDAFIQQFPFLFSWKTLMDWRVEEHVYLQTKEEGYQTLTFFHQQWNSIPFYYGMLFKELDIVFSLSFPVKKFQFELYF